MSSLPTGHVGDLAAALVDDQLDHPLRDLVLRHMIGCVMCRHDVEEQRQLKARLRALAEPGLPLNLFSRLSALNEPPKPVRPVEPAEPLGSPLLGPDDAALLALVADAGPSLGRSPFLRDSHRDAACWRELHRCCSSVSARRSPLPATGSRCRRVNPARTCSPPATVRRTPGPCRSATRLFRR